MNTKHRAFGDALKEFSGQSRFFSVAVSLVDFSGGLESGILLSQMIWWADRTKNDEGWFYKSYDDWYSEIRVGKKKVMSFTSLLESKGVIQTKVKKDPIGTPKKHYKMNFDRLGELFSDFKENNVPLTETASELSEVPEGTIGNFEAIETQKEKVHSAHWESSTVPQEQVDRVPEHFLSNIHNRHTEQRYRTEIREERMSATQSQKPTEVCDCEILEESEPLKNRSYPLAIHTPIVARSENKKVPGAARGRKAIESDHVARVCATWNEGKGALWASIRIPPVEARSKAILKFVQSCGSIETAIEYMAGALEYMRNDRFWAPKKGLTIENVMSNGKIQQNYEKHLDLKENPAIGEVAEKLQQMQEPKSFDQMRMESNKRAGQQAVINRMKNHPEEFEPEELAEYRSKYPQEFETRSSLHAEF